MALVIYSNFVSLTNLLSLLSAVSVVDMLLRPQPHGPELETSRQTDINLLIHILWSELANKNLFLNIFHKEIIIDVPKCLIEINTILSILLSYVCLVTSQKKKAQLIWCS